MSGEDILKEAISQGYNPDYKGENAKTPEQFVEDGKKIAPIQAERLKTLEAKLEESTKQQKEFFDQQIKMTLEAKQSGYDKAIADIKKQKREAVAEADTDKFDELDKEEANLKPPEPVIKEPPIAIDPDFVEWQKDNSWYKIGTSDEITIEAEIYGDALRNRKKNLTNKQFYNEVSKYVKLKFPDNFKKKEQNTLDISDHSNRDPGGNTPSSLPPEAKKAFNMAVKNMNLTKEEQQNWIDQRLALEE